MAGIVTTVFASILVFVAGGLFALPFTIYDEDTPNQSLAALNGLLFVVVAFYVGLDALLLIGALVAGIAVIGGISEILR